MTNIRHIHVRIDNNTFRKLQFKAFKQNKKLNVILTELIRDFVKDCSEDEMKEVCIV